MSKSSVIGRIESSSDGMFEIAASLLIIEIKVPNKVLGGS